MRKVIWHSPIFGRCVAREQQEEPAGTRVAYVETEGSEGTLAGAIYMHGTWHTRSNKPLQGKVVAWFRLEDENGKALF